MTIQVSRRGLLAGGVAVGAVLLSHPARAVGTPDSATARALAAMQRHRDHIAHVDRIGVVDFARASHQPRLLIVDLNQGSTTEYLVAHGRGSDLEHTGWATRFSNQPGSFASSAGAYATSDLYVGAHGHSMRLSGLDDCNSNAEARALVIHAAWYVSAAMARATGKLGRSEGCFALSETDLGAVLQQLGPGRLLYADGAGRRIA